MLFSTWSAIFNISSSLSLMLSKITTYEKKVPLERKIFLEIFIHLKGRLTERGRHREVLHLLIHSQMAATTNSGPD